MRRVRLARSAEQRQFAASLHDLLAAADVPAAARRGRPATTAPAWRCGASSPGGVTALAVPERCGGLGASRLDLVVACEELGHHALPGPVAESVAAVPELLAALADERLSRRGWLAGAGRRGPDRHAGPAAVAAVRGGRRRRRAGPARRARHRLARHAGRPAPVGGPGPVAVAGPRPARCWPAGPPVAARGRAARSRPARWPARRYCSAPAAPCWRPACGTPGSGAVRPAGRGVPGGQAPARRRGDRPGVRPAAARRGGRRARRWRAPPPPGTSRPPGSPAPTRPTGPPAPRCRCTARSATPRSTTSPVADEGARAGRAPGAARPSTGPGSCAATGAGWRAHGADRRAAGAARRGPRAAGGTARSAAGPRRRTRLRPGAVAAAVRRDRRRRAGDPERYGGAGAGPVETHIVAEELGRGLAPSPLLGSAVLATQALLASGDSAACERLLPRSPRLRSRRWPGRHRPATGIPPRPPAPPPGRPDRRRGRHPARHRPSPAPSPATVPRHRPPPVPSVPAVSSHGGWVLAGEAHHVLDGDVADVLLAAARTPGGIGLFEVDPGGLASPAVP